METALHPPSQMEPVAAEPSPGAAVGTGEFAEPVGLLGRIPLVKPCFKKKDAQRKLDPKCLRALDPVLTSLLASDALVAGDGVFVTPKSLRARGTLCCSAGPKQAWRKRACPAQQAAAPPGAPPVGGLRGPPGPSGGERDPPDVSRPALPAATGERPVTPRDGEAGDGAPGGGPGDGIFRGKSEEASLDLVFDFLTQLQYHTHRDEGVAICADFLRGACAYGSDCAFHHTVLPYHWQIRQAEGGAWRSLCDDSQDQLERLYCNPDNESVQLKHQGRVFTLDLCTMRVQDHEFDRVRRLSTPASSVATPPESGPASNYHTVWKYFCKDNLGWREYSKLVVRLIEEASGQGLKEVRFVTLQNQYVLNVREGFQQNAVFGFRRPIRKRPVFLSAVLLAPYLRTLGGLSSSEGLSSSHPLSPTTPAPPPSTKAPPPTAQAPPPAAQAPPRLFPETWLPMGPCQDFLQVPVSPDDRSYRTVYSLFHRTVSETRFRVLRVLRVQNPYLWEKYKRKKEYMSRKMSESERGQNERHLFHGTSQDAVDGICKHNFDPRVCGKHATMFGQGSYFARKAVYSHNFSKRSPKGVHCMFLAKVLTGRVTVGNPCMRRPPPLCPTDPSSDLFDSCVDNWVDPQVFVIFNDDQSYPYFVIEYEEVSSTVSV
ncbi:protein mono-ADP-ribosyltransferase TIPARP-like [Anguilla anguilla]|uniref:protein mono-ADP-ribosyltransferase TIPARP-like n=1 Tax=Anguilla anguilla TaxID=7936 RepID=UPI0015AEF00A|nr:protein mono-ADP-ribosyltransferase TIPARP-like [Anguilla anguilla]XP_035280023.1 protein mono-ADP-ribosyltransferase TIPARP-like [Anguilla anguilla]